MYNSQAERISVKQIYHAAGQNAPKRYPGGDARFPEPSPGGKQKSGKSDPGQIQAQEDQDMIQHFRISGRHKNGQKIKRMKPDDTADVIPHPDRKVISAGNEIPFEYPGNPLP